MMIDFERAEMGLTCSAHHWRRRYQTNGHRLGRLDGGNR
jgi:hypothetical protein